MKTNVYITLKQGVLDTQGKAIGNALHGLGFDQVNDVRQGKFIELDIDATGADEAKQLASAMCEKLLANMVIEDYKIEVAA